MIIKENYSLLQHNTFGLDVKAKFYIETRSEGELKEVLTDTSLQDEKKMILGGGSNVLFTKDYDGLIIEILSDDIKIVYEDDDHAIVEADAGAVWHNLVLFCVEKNLGGIENLSLIPGKTGAAPIQNIGAYGQELKDSFVSLDGFFIDTVEEKTFKRNECGFGYRDSIFKHELKNQFAITKIRISLNKNPVLNVSYKAIQEEINKFNFKTSTIKDVSDLICKIRRSKLPDPSKIGNAGSIFKNPEIRLEKFEKLKIEYPDIVGYPVTDSMMKVYAGWLIEKAGLRGERRGNVGTHEKQALVIVNYGGATGQEIIEFKDYIKSKVFEKFGILLEEEVNII
jgi:UDP-N-acetylmuramate dehydrogenase